VLAAAVLVADQLTKRLAVERLARGPLHIIGPISLRLEYNTGLAFSLGSGSAWPQVLAVVAFIGVLVLATRGLRSDLLAVGLGLVLGGALGNLADRFVSGHGGAIVDFVRVGFWPTFNLADAAIVVGCGLVLVARLALRAGKPAPGGGALDGASAKLPDGTGHGAREEEADPRAREQMAPAVPDRR
jgi:signal peptidase II